MSRLTKLLSTSGHRKVIADFELDDFELDENGNPLLDKNGNPLPTAEQQEEINRLADLPEPERKGFETLEEIPEFQKLKNTLGNK